MKKLFFKLSFFAITCSIFLTSCENFFNGSLVREELEEAIEYANAQYADITINSLTAATESILPSVGNYNTKYKRTDSFGLSFKPTEKYQFVKWVASPASSVAFDNEYSLTPTVTVLSVESPISIEPQVYIRPTVSITPKNGSAVEKNNPVIITFSHPVEATAEDLNKITIMSGGISYTENFSAPSLSDDKKVITYTAKEDNLISFSENTKDITITVPSSYYYLADETKVYMEKDVNYTYTVNNQTLTKLEITVNNTNTAAGSLNLNGKYKLNIGEKQNLLFSILQEYAFEKWIVKNADGQEVDHSTYSQFFDFENVKSNNTNIVVKKLAKDFVIEPVCVKRAQVVASTPAYSSVGVARTSSIRVIFDQDMSDHSIYWTETEMKEIKASFATDGSIVTYENYKVANKKSENNESYYYAYQLKTSRDINKYYKNIDVKIRGTSISLINGEYFGCPYFETQSILVIPTVQSDDVIDPFIDVEFVLSKGFVNRDGIEMAREYSSCYHTNGNGDSKGPTLHYKNYYRAVKDKFTHDDYVWEIGGTHSFLKTNWKAIPEFGAFFENDIIDEAEKARQEKFTVYETRKSLVSNASTLDELKELNVGYANTIEILGTADLDDDSGITDLVLTLTPVSNKLYPNQSDQVYRLVKGFGGEKKVENINMLFNLSSLKIEGLYELTLSVSDVVGNVTPISISVEKQIEVRSGYYDWSLESISVYCLVDNVNNGTFTCVEKGTDYNNDDYWVIEGTKGDYIFKDTKGKLITSNNISEFWKPQEPATVHKIENDGGRVTIRVNNRGLSYVTPYIIMRDELGNLKALAL